VAQLDAAKIVTAPWLILRSTRMSDDRRAAWTQDLHALGVETYYPMIRQMMKVPRDKLSRAQRIAGIVLMKPRVVPFFPECTLARGPDVLGVLEEQPHVRAENIGNVPIGTVVAPAPPVDTKKLRVQEAAVGFLAVGEDLTKVPDALISELKRRELNGVIPGASSAEWKFEKGEAVWIVNGPFTGLRATIETPPACELENVDSDSKLVVALSLLGAPRPVTLTVGDVRKA
jgi:hypothetical protein